MDSRHLSIPTLLAVGSTFALCSFAATPARAQGCVASRLDARSCALGHEGQISSYSLPQGRWQASFGYRFFRSHRHFVGSIEQDGRPGSHRDRGTTEVVNHVHIPTLTLTYGLNDRLSLSADVPVLLAHRSGPPSATRPFRQHTDARGIADTNLVGRYWLGDPVKAGYQNISVGLGLKLPTGNKSAEDEVWIFNNTTQTLESVRRPVDQSIQPGDGGLGVLAEIQGFKAIGSSTMFASVSYLFNPKQTNGVPTNRGRATEAFMSVADQYAARVGVAGPAPRLKGLGWSLGARLEGLPVEDVFGSSDGFRRPGYSVGVEPGLSYSWRSNSISVSVPYLVRRVRNTSVSDRIVSAERGEDATGDAAFADYVIIAGFTRRF